MDEEIDDERKSRINKYGSGDTGYTTRRLRHEIGKSNKINVKLRGINLNIVRYTSGCLYRS